jgi:hypothetical protein
MTALTLIIGLIFIGNLLTSSRNKHYYHRSDFPHYHWNSSFENPYYPPQNPYFYPKKTNRDAQARFYTFCFLVVLIAFLIFMGK